jgi:hypothetical protein
MKQVFGRDGSTKMPLGKTPPVITPVINGAVLEKPEA